MHDISCSVFLFLWQWIFYALYKAHHGSCCTFYLAHPVSNYRIAGKVNFGEFTTIRFWREKDFSLAKHRSFVKFNKFSCYTVPCTQSGITFQTNINHFIESSGLNISSAGVLSLSVTWLNIQSGYLRSRNSKLLDWFLARSTCNTCWLLQFIIRCH